MLSPAICEKQCLDEFGSETRRPPPSRRAGRGSALRSLGDSPYLKTSPQRVGGYWPTYRFLVKDNG